MKFERLRLENFKCFESVDVGLEAGVTVIHGLNGSGKSSLLEAGFFALYGARALDSTLDDVVTLGADETVVELWFTHGGQAFHVRRRLRVRESGTQTVECVLEGPAGTFEGATDVRARVTELLRMDETAFVNCAYVRQGEVNKLIEAAPAQRQDMIDDLLQLGRLEDYRDRASDARVGVGRVRDAKRERLAQLDEQIADKEDKDLQDRLNERQAALAEVTEEIAEYEEQRAAAVETLEAAEEVLETHEEHRAELAEVEATIDELRDTIATTERERDALADDLAELRTERSECVEKRDTLLAETELDPGDDEPTPAAVAERVEVLEAERDDLRDRIEALSVEKTELESEATAAREAAADLAERAEEKRARATELAEEATESRATLSERRETLESLREEIAAIEADFEDAPVDIGEAATWVEELTAEIEALTDEIGTIEGTIESERAALEEAKDLRDAGKCPTCGQPVEGAPHVETIEADEEHVEALEADLAELQADRETLEDRRERATALRDREAERSRLRDRRDSLSELIEQAESSLDETEARVETLREEAAELETTATAKRESASEADAAAEEIREEIGTVNSTQTTLNERMATLEELRETCERIDELAGEIERVTERRESLAETNDERRERLREKRERKAELEDALADVSIEDATADRDRAEAYIEEVDETLAERRERRDELQAAIGAIENELEALADLRERREGLAATVDRLETLYEEAEALEGLYGDLRAELRRRNVDTLERMLNESFELIYENDSYSRIELDGDYRLTVYQKDGEPLRPDQLSGGERALFNLSLRSAIYRLLAEGIEGAAPMPPLILDEPTVFLDAGHVSRLVDLIEHMREIGVEQLLVVSHDEELVAAADDLLAVRKDATSNRSSVQRVDGTAPISTPAD